MRKIIYISIFTFISMLLLNSAQTKLKEIDIKVHITEVSLPITIKVAGSYDVVNYKYNSVITSGKDGSVTIQEHEKGIKVEGFGVFGSGVAIVTEDGFTVNGSEYYDDAVIVKDGDKGILINRLDIENYIKGVLPYEMSPSWPVEALKAQALAARSYAIYHYSLNQKDGRVFDVDNTTKYQVYKGKEKVNDSVEEAVAATKNQVITYKNKVIGAFFHSICGGHTDSTKNLFGKDVPYLRGSACYYCKDKIEVWTNHVSYSTIENTFGIKNEDKINIRIKGSTLGGKASELSLASGSHSLNIKASEFRSKVGATVIPSLSFKIKANGVGVNFIGPLSSPCCCCHGDRNVFFT